MLAGFPSARATMSSNPAGTPMLARLVHHYDELVAYVARAAGRFYVDRHQLRDTAREAVHEVCLQLLNGGDDTRGVQVPLAFLRTLSKRRAIDHLRREMAWHHLAGSLDEHPGILDMVAAAHTEPEQRALAAQQLRLLAQAIESLPPRCREVFVLHKIHEWPQAAVARHLGISLKTVEKHLRIAVACCRFALAELRAEAG